MRLKQQTFVDKYIEKVILGVAVLIGAAIVFFYVLRTPYAVELAPGQKATPDDVEQSYLQKANSLKAAVRRPEPPEELTNLKIPDYVSRFRDRYAQRLVHSDSFYHIVFGPPGVAETGPGIVGPVRNPLVIDPPAPTEVTASANYFVLESDASLQLAFTDLAHVQYPGETEESIKTLTANWTQKAVSLAGGRDPRDFWGVSVGGTINPQEWVDAFAKVPAERATPVGWYEELSQFIAGIEIERQTLDPVTGQWSAEGQGITAIEPLPGAVSTILREYVKQVQDAKTGALKVDDDEASQLQNTLVENLRFYLEDLTKPMFVPVKAHRPWQQPDQIPLELSPADQTALLRINQQITKYESEMRALIGRAGTATGGDATKPGGKLPPRLDNPYGEGRPPTVRPPTGAPKGVPAPKGKAPQPGADPTKKASPIEDRITLYQTRLADLYKQREDILIKLYKDDEKDPTKVDPSRDPSRDPRIDPSRIRPVPGRPSNFDPYSEYTRPGRRPTDPLRPGSPATPAVPGAADNKIAPIKFWAHDVTVKPGMTYRYRVRYKVINPLFNKEDQLIDALKPKAAELEQASAPSAWSAPVVIEAPVRYFVEDVKPETSSVVWGIYSIFNGYRIHKQFTTRPGDAIGKTTEIDVKDDLGGPAGKAQVDLGVDAILVDLKTPPRVAGAIGVRGPMTVLIADLEEGNVSMRDPNADKNDADRVRLFNEATGALSATPAATGPTDPLRPPFPGPGGLPPDGGRIPIPPPPR